MKTTTTYITNYSYCNGNLGADHVSASREEAEMFEQNYINNFSDGNKCFITNKVTTKKFFGFVVKVTVERVNEWSE
jgi:hypothetical protein